MDDIKPKKNNRIEELERDLYDPAQEHGQRPRRKIHDRNIELDHDFKDDAYDDLIHARSKYRLPTSLFKKIFLVVLVFFVVTVAVAGISLYEGRKVVSEDLIAMEILGQPFVDGGEELELEVRIQNFNEQDLQLPDLVLSYPKDSAEDAEVVFLRRSLEDIGPRERVTEDFDLTLFGQEGNTRSINATLEYRIDGSSAIFVKEIAHEVIIRSTPTQVLIDAPDTIVRNQEVTIGIDIASNSIAQVRDTVLKVTYPRGFEFLSSNRAPSFNDNTWYFSDIDQDVEHIEFTGRLAALEGQGQSFVIEFGKQHPQNKHQIETVFNSIVHTIEVQKSFLTANLSVNNSTEPVSSVRGGADVSVLLEYENTLPDPVTNAVIEVRFDGDLYNRSDVSSLSGFYDSSRRTLVFDSSSLDNLSRLDPGERGQVRFTVGTKDLVTASGVLDNPSFAMSVDVHASELNGMSREAFGVATHTVRANSDISVTPKVQYYEGAFANSGPLPPRANLSTTYTIVFQLSNSSNDVSSAELRTTLPRYVTWLNAVAPSIERNKVSFDTGTRQLIWNIGDMPAGLGVGTNQPEQLSVQIELTPSVSQIGNPVQLTGDILLSGTDEFTDTDLNYRKTPVINNLQDSQAPNTSGQVRE